MKKPKTKSHKSKAAARKANVKTKKLKTPGKTNLPRKDASAELRFHRFLNLWNAHIREQIKIHQLILKGKESLKAHITHTEKAHKKFLSQLKKV